MEKYLGQARHLESLIEAGACFRISSEFLILNPEIEISFRVGRFLFDLFQPECEKQALVRANTVFTTNLTVVMNDGRKGRKPKIGRQLCRIDGFVNEAM